MKSIKGKLFISLLLIILTIISIGFIPIDINNLRYVVCVGILFLLSALYLFEDNTTFNNIIKAGAYVNMAYTWTIYVILTLISKVETQQDTSAFVQSICFNSIEISWLIIMLFVSLIVIRESLTTFTNIRYIRK